MMDTTVVSIKESVDTMAGRALVVARQQERQRRRFSDEQKRRMVEETLEPGASVSVVARRHDINANLLFNWRVQYRAGLLGAAKPALLPVEISAAPLRSGTHPERSRGARKARIEIEFRSGHRLRVAGVDAATLQQVIETLAQ